MSSYINLGSYVNVSIKRVIGLHQFGSACSILSIILLNGRRAMLNAWCGERITMMRVLMAYTIVSVEDDRGSLNC
jgi:hypothetical protein